MSGKMVETYWSRFAEDYDQKQEYVAGKEFFDLITSELNHLTDLGEVLELGCGTGIFTEALARKATGLIATDLSDELLEKAKMRLERDASVTFKKENCMNLSLPTGKFDSVFMANLLHVIEDPRKVVQESHRILKAGGKLILVTYTSCGMRVLDQVKLGIRFIRTWGKPPQHTHNFSLESLASLFESEGFKVIASKYIGDRTRAIYLICTKQGYALR